MQFISTFAKTLNRLVFDRVALVDGSWTAVLKGLASVLEQLENLTARMIREYNPGLRMVLGPEEVWEGSEEERDLKWYKEDHVIDHVDSGALFEQYRQDYKQKQNQSQWC